MAVAKGARGTRRLDRDLHMQVLELWATEVPAFDKLLDKFKADVRRPKSRAKGRRGQAKNIEIKNWNPRGRTLTDQENAWLQTRRTVTVMPVMLYML